MSHKNPWFLITNDEIEEIRKQLRYFGSDPSGPNRAPVQEIDILLRKVRDRRP
jgi:hypothetical protein